MADIIPFDKFHRIKKRLPGYGTVEFPNAYVEARVLVYVAEGNFLRCSELTHLGSKLLSPLGSRILQEIVRHMDRERRSVAFE
jgi:hypothetical protein